MHAKRSVAFVVETEETSAQLVERLRPVLVNERFRNYWCLSPGIDVIGKDGVMDPLTARVRQAYERVRQFNQAEYMRKPKRPKPVVERPVDNLVSPTAIKVSYRPRRKRKPPRQPNRNQGY